MTLIADHVASFEEAPTTALIDQGWKTNSGQSTRYLGSGQSLVTASDIGTALSLPSGSGIFRHTITSDATNPYVLIALVKTSAGSRRIFSANYSGLGIGMYCIWKSDGTFEIFDRSGTSKGVSNTAYSTLNKRYYLQLSWSSSSSSENLKLYVDGTLDKTYTGDWRGGGINTAGLTEFHICSDGSSATTGSDITIDDVYLAHETGGFTALTFPNLKMETLKPTSDGGTLELTPSTGSSHFAVVDEDPPDTADYLSSSPLAGTTTRTDLFGYPQPTTDDTTKNVYAFSGYSYAEGSTGNDDRLQLQTNYPSNTPETQTIANFNGNGSLTTSAFLYSCPFALPINSLSSGGGGVQIGSFHINYTFGPRIVRSSTVTASSHVDTWALTVAKSYFVPTGGWQMGFLAFN